MTNDDMDDIVDYLRDNGYKPQWFGLGFIQVKLGPTQRYHFWHPELSQDVAEEDIHDHRYQFISQILRGKLEHHVFEFEADSQGTHEMYDVSCNAETPGPVGTPVRGIAHWSGSYFMREGDMYNFPVSAFHRTKAELCVTHVTRGDVVKPLARVIRPVGAPHICPFEKKIDEERLWLLMDECMRFSLR